MSAYHNHSWTLENYVWDGLWQVCLEAHKKEGEMDAKCGGESEGQNPWPLPFLPHHHRLLRGTPRPLRAEAAAWGEPPDPAPPDWSHSELWNSIPLLHLMLRAPPVIEAWPLGTAPASQSTGCSIPAKLLPGLQKADKTLQTAENKKQKCSAPLTPSQQQQR